MRTCKHCNIQIGGDWDICPLCQTKLKGQKEDAHFPYHGRSKHLSLPIKIILFIILSSCAVFLMLDLTYSFFDGAHPSIITCIWVAMVLLTIKHYFRNHRSIPKIIFNSMLLISILTYATTKIYNCEWLAIDYIIPIWCCLTLIVNFIFCLINAGFTESALIFLLLNIVVGIFPYVIILLRDGSTPILWTISFLTSVVTFIGISIFKGKTVLFELQKRMHL